MLPIRLISSPFSASLLRVLAVHNGKRGGERHRDVELFFQSDHFGVDISGALRGIWSALPQKKTAFLWLSKSSKAERSFLILLLPPYNPSRLPQGLQTCTSCSALPSLYPHEEICSNDACCFSLVPRTPPWTWPWRLR